MLKNSLLGLLLAASTATMPATPASRGDRDQARWRVHGGDLGAGAGGQRLPPARSEGRRAADLRHRREGRLRRDQPLRRHPRARSRAGSAGRPAHAPRHRLVVRLAEGDRRLVPRSAHRVRVRGQSRGRQGGPRLVERRQRRQRLGRGVGRRGLARQGRLARGVPHSVLAAALPSRRQRDLRLRGRPPDRPVERDRHLAAHLEERRPASCRRSATSPG